MKTSAVIRIIVGLLIAALLTGVLVSALTGGWNWNFSGLVFHLGGSDEASDADLRASEAVNRLNMDGIKQISIIWVAGNVYLKPAPEGDTDVVFAETAAVSLTDAQKLRYSAVDGKLTIQYCETMKWTSDRLNMPEKNLTVTVPASLLQSLDRVSIEVVSANAEVSGLTADALSLSTVSGNIRCTETSARKLEMESVSGKVDVDGTFNYVNSDSVSGNVTIRSASCPQEVDAESVSGEIRLSIPENSDFKAVMDSASGDLSCAFPGTMQRKSVVVGNGTSKFEFDTVSGDVQIEKN